MVQMGFNTEIYEPWSIAPNPGAGDRFAGARL